MRRGGRILILLGLILGFAVFAVAFLFLQQTVPTGPSIELQTTVAVTARQPISQCSVITVEMLDTVEVRIEESVNTFTNPGQVAGLTALREIPVGSLITRDMVVTLQEAGARGLASCLIPEGRVALAFPLTDLSSVAGAIQASDFVDVLATITFEAELRSGTERRLGQALVTQTILQDAQVLHIGLWTVPVAPQTQQQQQQQQAPAANFITLAVTPQDALVLKYLRDDPTFRVDFALRRATEHGERVTESVTLQYILTRFNVTIPEGPEIIVVPF